MEFDHVAVPSNGIAGSVEWYRSKLVDLEDQLTSIKSEKNASRS